MNLKQINTKVILPSSLIALSSLTAAAANERSNVIFILVDDLSYFATSPYGAKSVNSSHFKDAPIKTPNMQRLANEGVMCTHGYAHALSEATRVALMTGMNGGRNFLQCKSLHHSQITFGDAFKREGYATGMYGKWKQTRGTKNIPGVRYISEFGWDDYACFDVVDEGQRYINPEMVVNDKSVSYKGRTDLDPHTNRRWYGPDIFNRKALEFIETNKDKPFFLYYSMVLIHDEHKPTPDTKPYSVFDTTSEAKKNDLREYFPDMIEYTDKLIGKVIDKVEDLGLRENTLIVVMGDNGSKEFVRFTLEDGSLHYGSKGHTRYGGEQIPLIFSKPGTIPCGENKVREYTPTVDLTDIYPTIMNSCGLDVPNAEEIDGVSFWKQLTAKSSKAHRECIYKWYNGNNSQKDLETALRYAQTSDFKYYAPHDVYPQGRFFDLRTDSLEHAGAKGRKMGWMNYWYSGLDLDKLTPEQAKAYKMLKAEVERNNYVAVERIAIAKAPKKLAVGKVFHLEHSVIPRNATRIAVIWNSSNPEVVSVNKFGEITTHSKGEATITLYSWDDAWPVANGPKTGGYLKDGIKDSVKIIVE